MRKPTTWIVVADGGRARIFERGPKGQLNPVLQEALAGDRRPSRDIGSDRPGRAYESVGGARHAQEPPTDPHRHAKEVFAKEIVALLDGERAKQAFEALILVAPPQFLGDLRAALPTKLKEAVVGELDKDLTKQTVEEVAQHTEELG